MFEPLYTAAEMQAAEAGHDVDDLMARAGRAVAEEAMRRFPDARRFAAVCGGGANGGDGRIAVDVLRSAGREAEVTDDVAGADVIVDALFGTGFQGEPREDAARRIEAINAAGVPVVAVDLPSGVDASTGEIAGACVQATLTVTMHGRKVGLEVAPGRFHAGEVVVADIGLEPAETEHALVGPEILDEVPRRRSDQNKYTAGTVLVVGGSRGLTGAPCLAAEAAFRADAGYVAVAVPDSTLAVFEARLLEAVKLPCPEKDGRISLLALDPIAEFAEGGSRRARPGARARRGTQGRRGASPGPARGARRRRRGRALRARAVRAIRADRAHAARGRARAPARGGVELGRGPPARGGPAGSGAVRLRLPAQGRRHADRGSRRGHPRLRARHPCPRDGRKRRRPDRNRGGLPRERARAAPGCSRGGRRATARLDADPAGRRGRERRHRCAPAGPGLSAGSVHPNQTVQYGRTAW